MGALRFGIFDHMDGGSVPAAQLFAERLRIVEAYEQGRFHGYHVAEHHSTPLGRAPSPSVYLAAVAARTKRIRFGPMVYLLPMYHPLRLAEEVTMLDQLGNGRLDVGIGTGISSIELESYGIDKADSSLLFSETLSVMKQVWTHDSVTFEGQEYNFKDVPVVTHPVQKPYPPLYYGVGHPEAAPTRLAAGFHGITMSSRDAVRGIWSSEEALAAIGSDDRNLGVARLVVVDRDSAKAWDVARRAYRVWEQSFHYLWRLFGVTPVFGWRPSEFEGIVDLGIAIAGNPEEVGATIQEHLDEAGSNYFVGQFVFGDMSLAESLRSVELFATDVMPMLSKARSTPV